MSRCTNLVFAGRSKLFALRIIRDRQLGEVNAISREVVINVLGLKLGTGTLQAV